MTVEESGIVHYVKRPGTLLEAGCVVARLQLDDSTKVHLVSDGAAGSSCPPEATGLPPACPGASGDEQPCARTPVKSFPDHRKLQNGGFSGYNVPFIFHVLPFYPPMLPPGPVVHGGALSSAAPAHPWREAAPGLPPHAGEPAECHERLLLARALFLRQGKTLLGFSFSPLPIKNQAWKKAGLGYPENTFLTSRKRLEDFASTCKEEEEGLERWQNELLLNRCRLQKERLKEEGSSLPSISQKRSCFCGEILISPFQPVSIANRPKSPELKGGPLPSRVRLSATTQRSGAPLLMPSVVLSHDP